MAYAIQCHIVDPAEERIRMTVTFYGETEKEAQEIYDEWYGKKIELSKVDDAGDLLEEEGEIPDDELPELEDDDDAGEGQT